MSVNDINGPDLLGHSHNRPTLSRVTISQTTRQRHQDRDQWLSLLSQNWTKRQSPEWRPRRASVATCQQRQSYDTCREPIMMSHTSEAESNIMKFLSQRFHQSNQRHLEAHLFKSNNRHKQLLFHGRHHNRTLTSTRCPSQIRNSPPISKNENNNMIPKKEISIQEPIQVEESSRELTLSPGNSVTEQYEFSKLTGPEKFVRSSWFEPYLTDKVESFPSKITCCIGGSSTADGKLNEDGRDEGALTLALNEKLLFQDKQRKFLILSMALRQMISGSGSLTNECDHNCRSKSCTALRSVSGSNIPNHNNKNCTRAQQSATDTKSVLSSSRSMLIDRLPTCYHNEQRAAAEQEPLDESNKVQSVSKFSRESSLVNKNSKRYSIAEILNPTELTNLVSINSNQELLSTETTNKTINESMENLSSNCYLTIDSCYLEQRSEETDDQATRNDIGKCNELKCLIGRTSCDTDRKLAAGDSSICLESLIVESWLDDHPLFVHDYFMRKGTRQIIDDWLITNAKVSNTSLGSQLDLSVKTSISPKKLAQLSFNSHLQNLGLKAEDESYRTTPVEPDGGLMGASIRPTRSRSHSSGCKLSPMRKISATDFESRTGNGFLRPMLSTTADGRPTFLLQVETRHEETNDGRDEVENKEKTSERNKRDKSFKLRADFTSECDTNEKNDESDEMTKDDEVKLIFELVKNICSDLDIETLLLKILKNIAVLINADKSSLFLVCGDANDPNRHLVSQLFNVDQNSEIYEPEDCIILPWGTGLVGHVAESGESLNITDCYKDPRFTNAVDQRTGYVTRHMLCAPIYNKRNEIVGVAQVINKRDGKPFSGQDEAKFKRYLQFCGIGLCNAQSYEQCQLENRRNQVLLDLARMVFEEQSTIQQIVHRIMLHTQSLLECQRCQVLLIDDGSDNLDQLFQMPRSPVNCQQQRRSDDLAFGPKPKWRPQCSAGSASSINQAMDDPDDEPQGEDLSGTPGEHQSPKLFSLVFDLECDSDDLVMHSTKTDYNSESLSTNNKLEFSQSPQNRKFPINIGITGYVATTGETLNIEDAHSNDRFDPSVDQGTNFRHKSILCMPIRNGQRQIIGVSQLINKKNGRPFNKNDEDLFEAFAIFCGLGIHNTLMYEKVLKIMAKQRVTFEVLSYHATAPLEEAKKLYQEQVPSCFSLNLTSLKFNDFSLDDQYMLKSCLRFFLDLDLIRRFQIDQLVFCNWILSVQKNYRKVTYHPIVGGTGLKASPVRYHNWRHAFNVSQMMFAILVNTQICRALGELETLAILIACLCHDLDHRGTNNSFQIKSASPLAELYSTSTMEHHHFDQCIMILNSQGNQILANLSPEEYSRVIVLLEEAILATDLANYFQKRELFFKLVNDNQFEWHNNSEHRSLLRCMLMTACDVAAITKPWPVQKVVADLVMSEFYQQGDIEKQELHIEPIDMMNRDKMSKLPEMQIGFIDSICAPIYTAFAKLFPRELGPLLEGCLSNRHLWAETAKMNDTKPDPPINTNYLNNNSSLVKNLSSTSYTNLLDSDLFKFDEIDPNVLPPEQSFNSSCCSLLGSSLELRSVSARGYKMNGVDCQRNSV